MEKPKAKKALKTYGRSSQDIFEFRGGSDGELDVMPRTDLVRNAGKRSRRGSSKAAETVSSQAPQDEDVTRRAITSSERDTELLSTESKANEIFSAGDKDVSLQNSIPPPASKLTSFEHSQRSEYGTMPAIADPTPHKTTTSNPLLPARTTCFETHLDDRMPISTRSLRGDVDDGSSPSFVQSGNLSSMRSNAEMKAIDLQPSEKPAPSSSASEITPSKTITVRRTSKTTTVSQEPTPHLDDEHLRPQIKSNVSTIVNPVVLLPAPPDTDGGWDELSLSVPEKLNKSPTKLAKRSKRKRSDEDGPVDELGSDDNAVGIPKEQYKPRSSKRRSGDGNEEVFIPTDFSKKPEAIGKVKRKTKRHKTTAFQELLPQADDEDEEVRVAPDPRFEIPAKKTSKISTEADKAEVHRTDATDEIRARAQPEEKPVAKGNSEKKRGRPKKATKLSEENVVDEAEADHDQEDAEAEEAVVSATAEKSGRMTTTRETPKPITEEQDHTNDSAPAVGDDSEDLPGNVFNETHGNIIASNLSAELLPEKSPTKASPPPETPRRTATPALKGPDKHSPISSGKVAYRVGLSKRARIAPLLRIVRK